MCKKFIGRLKMKRLLYLLILTLLLVSFGKNDSFARRFKYGSPGAVVSELYRIYKRYDFRRALFITTGKEQLRVKQMIKLKNRNFGRPPLKFQAFIAKIQDLKVLSQTIKGKYARVDAIWVLKYKDGGKYKTTGRRGNFKIKVNEVWYALKKVKNKWLILGSRFIKQHMLHNYAQVYSIYKIAKPFKDQKGKGKGKKRRRRRSRRLYRRR